MSIFVYITIAVMFCAALPVEVLATDYTSMKHADSWPVLIDAGVIREEAKVQRVLREAAELGIEDALS